jgi:hypothetical protein
MSKAISKVIYVVTINGAVLWAFEDWEAAEKERKAISTHGTAKIEKVCLFVGGEA